MQERLSVDNVKHLHVEGGLPHVHYFPTKGEEASLIKDENEHAKKSYIRRVVCSKTSILLVLLLLVALTSYLLVEIPRQNDDDIEEISVTEWLLINHGDSNKYQSIAYKNADTNVLSTEQLSDNFTIVEEEMQGDDSINESISQDHGRAPTEDQAEEIAQEMRAATHRLIKLMDEWSESSDLNSNSDEDEFDLTKLPPTDSAEFNLSLIILLIKAVEEAQASIVLESSEISDESDMDGKIWQSDSDSDEMMDPYAETYYEDKPVNYPMEWPRKEIDPETSQ